MPRGVKKTAPVETRNVKDEKPKGMSWDEAIDLLKQGYSVDKVADRTGFPKAMLARVARPLDD